MPVILPHSQGTECYSYPFLHGHSFRISPICTKYHYLDPLEFGTSYDQAEIAAIAKTPCRANLTPPFGRYYRSKITQVTKERKRIADGILIKKCCLRASENVWIPLSN